VEVAHIFSGNALGAIDEAGRVRLPPFILREMARHGDGGRLLLGVHETDPCITGYGSALQPRLEAELERRRLRDEALGLPADGHHARARRTFGLVEEARYGDDGRLTLPPLARRRGGLGRELLFIGAGSHFEIWDPSLAIAGGDEELRYLARYRLGGTGGPFEEEEEER
jgi:DNA-binding transcriptional regulator/RsmH inhibitor MraZ